MIDVAGALSGRSGSRGIRALLRSPSSRDLLRSLLDVSAPLGRCRLRRVKFKPGRKLSAYYDVSVGGPQGGVRSVALTWVPAGEEGMPAAADPVPVAALEAEAGERGLTAPFTALAAEVPAMGMRLLVSPLDPNYPQLVRLADPSYVSDLLGRTLGRSAASFPRVATVRFRPGQRHVLRYRDDGPHGRTVFAKLQRDSSAPASTQVAAEVAQLLADQPGNFGAALPAAHVGDDSVMLYDLIAGRPLTAQLAKAGSAAGDHLARAGSLLAALHTGVVPSCHRLRPRPSEGEIVATRRASEHITELLPHVGTTLKSVLSRAGELLDALPGEPDGFVHGDFKADHLLIGGPLMTLIDFDSCARAEPAYDLGKFLADLRYWFFTWNQSSLAAAQERFLEGYVPGAAPERLSRARAYEALVLVRLAAHRLRVDEVDWATRTSMLVNEADRLLRSVER